MSRVLFTPYPSVLPNERVPEDYQQIGTSPAMFGGLAAGAETRGGAELTQGGGELIGAAIQRQQVFNQIAGDQAVNNLMERYSKLTSGDPASGTPGLFAMRGADALSQGPLTLNALDDARTQIRDNLQNDRQRLEFDTNSRRISWYMRESIQRHLDQQQDTYGVETNKATQDVNLQAIGANWNDEGQFQTYLDRGTQGAIRTAQTLYGHNLTPDQTTATINTFRTRAVTARVEAWDASGDRTGALNWLKTQQKNIEPNVYDALTHKLESGADTDTARRALERAWPGSAGIAAAIQGQEGSGPTAVSPAGARGTRQVTQGLFNQYKQPGESFDSESDRVAVSDRALADYEQRWPGDPERVAVAYFSGPGNVAPPGSPTPWIRNSTDAGHTSVSQYVAGVTSRLGTSAAASAPAAVSPPDLSEVTRRLQADPELAANPRALDHAISLATERYHHFEQATADQRSQLEEQLKDGQTALENGKPYVWDEKAIRTLLPPQKADEVIQNLNDAKTLGEVGVFAKGASPDALNAKQAELAAKVQNGNAPDYRNNLAIYGAFQKAVAARGKALADDPAGFVLANSPEVQRAQQAVDPNNPTTTQAYDRAVLAEQTRLGLPVSQQSVMTKAEATDITQKIMSTDPATADLGAAFRGLGQQHGQYMPQVWGSLVRAGLSPQWQLLGSIDNPVGRGDYQRALQSIGKKGQAEWEKDIPSLAASDIKQNEDDAISDFRSSAAVPGVSLNGSLISMVKNGIDVLAKQYALQGLSGQSALDRARDTVLGRYDFVPNPNDSSVTMRVPSGKGDLIRNFAAEQQAQLQAMDLQPMPNRLDLTPAQAQVAAAEAAKSGIWVTSPDDGGMTLLTRLPGGLGYQKAVRANGSDVEFRFSDVPAALPPPPFSVSPVGAGVSP